LGEVVVLSRLADYAAELLPQFRDCHCERGRKERIRRYLKRRPLRN
jgi:hypothetical protein